MTATREMPRYKSHKKVWALKIAKIEPIPDSGGAAMITPADEGYAPFRMPGDYMSRHNPLAGGYFVVYQDGYQSFSPASAFEDGYTRIEDGE